MDNRQICFMRSIDNLVGIGIERGMGGVLESV